MCSATSPVDFLSAECVPLRPRSISGRKSMFRYVSSLALVGRVCFAMSWVDFWLAECVPPRQVNFWLAECVPLHVRSISVWKSVFRCVLGRFLVGRVCSTVSPVDFQSAECVPLCLRSIFGCVPLCFWSISGWQSVFRHVLGQFPVSRVCSAASSVDFQSTECVPPCPLN